jgi:hypothetical protein
MQKRRQNALIDYYILFSEYGDKKKTLDRANYNLEPEIEITQLLSLTDAIVFCTRHQSQY